LSEESKLGSVFRPRGRTELIWFVSWQRGRLENKSLRISVATNTKQNSNEHGFFSDSSEICTEDLPTLSEKSFPDDSELLARFKVLYSVSNDISKQKLIINAVCADSRTIPIKIISEDNMPNGYQMIFILYSDFFNGKNVTRKHSLMTRLLTKELNVNSPKLFLRSLKTRFPQHKRKMMKSTRVSKNNIPTLLAILIRLL
jgi:hypothetical protein